MNTRSMTANSVSILETTVKMAPVKMAPVKTDETRAGTRGQWIYHTHSR